MTGASFSGALWGFIQHHKSVELKNKDKNLSGRMKWFGAESTIFTYKLHKNLT